MAELSKTTDAPPQLPGFQRTRLDVLERDPPPRPLEPSKKDVALKVFLRRAERELREAQEKWGACCMGVYYAQNDIKMCKDALDAER